MASTVQASPRGIRLDQLDDFALAIAQQVWEQDAGLKVQADERKTLAWLRDNFPTFVTKPFGERHLRLWDWVDALVPGVKPRPRVEPWPRGGAKTTSGQMAVARVGYKKLRSFGLVISETQPQANKYVGVVGKMFGRLGLGRSVNQYGYVEGWNASILRVDNGFNLAAMGIDSAVRGLKFDEYRPDFIIFDDIDSQDDSPKTIEKKIDAITSAILPAGSQDCAVLFLQNLIHEEGIVAQLCDDRADFLLEREVPEISPAIIGLKVESVDRGDGRKVWKIVEGVPTWEGQDLEVCERQINEWGLQTFLREAQHEVNQADGYFFDHTRFEIVDSLPDDQDLRFALCCDLAATEGGSDYTVWVLMAVGRNGVFYILDVFRRQISSEKVRDEIVRQAERMATEFPGSIVHIPQDPGQAGKAQADQFRSLLRNLVDSKKIKLRIETVSGKKPIRARGHADSVNRGNVKLLRGEWNQAYIQEHRKFREDEDHEYDDQVDASSDGHNVLSKPRRKVELTIY